MGEVMELEMDFRDSMMTRSMDDGIDGQTRISDRNDTGKNRALGLEVDSRACLFMYFGDE